MKKIIKKVLILMLIAAMVVTTMPLTGIDFTNIISPEAKAATKTETFTWGDYEYKIINIDEIELVNYYGNDTEVTIPSEIDGIPVTSIGEYCFTGDDRPTNSGWIEHPNQIFNKRIKSIVVPSSVKTICAEAFSFIDSLENVVLNEGLELIDEFAFANCPKLTELKLPDSLITFSILAVTETPVEVLVFGSNVKEFNFKNFGELYVKKVIFNADFITIEAISLDPYRTQLEEIVCNGQLNLGSSFKISYEGAVKRIVCNSNVIYDDILTLAYFDMGANFNAVDGSVVFAEGEILLPGEYEREGFKYFVDDNSEAIISRYTGGESVVTVPENLDGYPVTQIGTLAFSSLCSSLYPTTANKDKLIPPGLITSVSLPETLKIISDYAFAGNFKLAEINIPSKITSIPYECFADCQSLKSIDIPDSVNEIEDGAFYWCESLESVSLPEGVTEIQDNTFNGCTALKSIEMPGVKKIGDDAFSYCYSLVIDELPQGVTELGERAFLMCWSFERLDLSNIIKIGEDAMFDCDKLREVILNDNLERIEHGVFNGCDVLESINFPSKLVSIGEWAFGSTVLKEITFNEGLKIIEAGAFDDCEALESIKLPSTLVSIGESGFRYTGLKEVVLNEGLKTIGAGAFANCDNLSTLVLPESLEYIWNGAFYRCHGIKEITIPANLKIMGYRAFSRCANLTTVYFNAVNCKVIDRAGDEAYVPEDWTTASPFYATKITNIYFGEDITAISSNSETYGTFENCETLESVTIPASVEEIGTAAFKNCTNLETAIIPDSVTEIADDAFDGCDNLIIYCSETSYACTYALTQGIKVSTFIVEAIPNYTYTGNSIEPALSVSVSNGKLSENKDYTVAYSNNINVGEAKVKITGLGDYRNFASVASFTIVTRSITATKISNISAQNYTGKAVTPDITVVYNGKVLKEGTDYRLHYFNNKNVGEATIHVEGIGNFSGSDSIKFTIEKLSASEILMNRLRDFFNTIFIRFTTFFVK